MAAKRCDEPLVLVTRGGPDVEFRCARAPGHDGDHGGEVVGYHDVVDTPDLPPPYWYCYIHWRRAATDD